jgi:hypothetical protein
VLLQRTAVIMSTRVLIVAQLAVIGFMVAALSPIKVTAQDSSNATMAVNTTETGTTSQTASVQLSVGVWDVLKLVQSKVEDDTTIAFINNSGTTYRLSASEIVYLRGQGVSDRVLTAMLNQRSKTPVAAVPSFSAEPSASTSFSAPAPATTAPPAPVQTSNTYVAPAPVYAQASTVYVAPPTPAYYPDYGYYYPPVSLSFGFGFGGYYGWHGGYHGHGGYYGHGGYGGGGYHGGGSHSGHH